MRKRLQRCCAVCPSGSASVASGPLRARPRPALAAPPGGTRDHRRAGPSASGRARRHPQPTDGAAHEQRSRVEKIIRALQQFYNGKVGPPTVNAAPGAQRAHRIVQQPATHGAPEPQPLNQPPASTGDEATSNTSTITDTRIRRWATCPGRVRARSRQTTNPSRCAIN